MKNNLSALLLVLFAIAMPPQARAAWVNVHGSCMNDSSRQSMALHGIEATAFQWTPSCDSPAEAMWVAITVDQCLELGAPGKSSNEQFVLYLDIANIWTEGSYNISHPLVQSAARACGATGPD